MKQNAIVLHDDAPNFFQHVYSMIYNNAKCFIGSYLRSSHVVEQFRSHEWIVCQTKI